MEEEIISHLQDTLALKMYVRQVPLKHWFNLYDKGMQWQLHKLK
jgi:hypothetical protein